MSETTLSTMRSLLDGTLERTDDSESAYKLRTALQLLDYLEEEQSRAREALDDAELGEETRERLRELGYLD